MGIKRTITGQAVAAALIFLLAGGSLSAATIQLPKGTEAKVKFASGMEINSGKVEKDIPLLIMLAEPIKIGSKVIVEEGAQGTAKVVEAEKSGRVGKPGYIKVEFVDLEVKGNYKPVNADKIKLSGTLEHRGKSKKTLSLIVFFGLFIKGGQGKIDTDRIHTATVGETLILEGE